MVRGPSREQKACNEECALSSSPFHPEILVHKAVVCSNTQQIAAAVARDASWSWPPQVKSGLVLSTSFFNQCSVPL